MAVQNLLNKCSFNPRMEASPPPLTLLEDWQSGSCGLNGQVSSMGCRPNRQRCTTAVAVAAHGRAIVCLAVDTRAWDQGSWLPCARKFTPFQRVLCVALSFSLPSHRTLPYPARCPATRWNRSEVKDGYSPLDMRVCRMKKSEKLPLPPSDRLDWTRCLHKGGNGRPARGRHLKAFPRRPSCIKGGHSGQ